MKRKLPQPEIFLGKRLPQHPDIEIVELIGTGLMAHVFRAHDAKLQRDFACKIIPCDNLVGADCDPPLWRAEFLRANETRSSHVVKFNREGTWEVEEKRFVYWIAEYVRGKSLRNMIKSTKIDVAFVEIFLEEMLEFLNEMQEDNIQHGDLHSGNVIVEDKPRALRGPKFGFKVTDFGVAPTKTGAKFFDDFEQLGLMTCELLETIDYPGLSPEDRFVYDWINDRLLAKHFFEQDVAYDPVARNPEALVNVVRESRRAFIAQTVGETRKTLTTPFDYLSCEQIGESHVLLKELYSDKLLGLVAIEERNNLVLTGPRGCGKTTVFRSLSLKHRYHTNDDAPESLGYVGIYYMCNDLYFNFPRYEIPGKEEALNIPLHYLSVTLIRELLESLSLWLQRHFAAEWQAGEASAAKALWDLLQLNPPTNIDSKKFASLIRGLESQRKKTANKQRFVNTHDKFGPFLGPEVVPEACAILKKHFPAISGRDIFFFIDDYSIPKITHKLQRNLNRLLMQRTPDCFFKLATESPASFANNDVDDKVYVESREYRLLNLGMDFIYANEDEKLRFVDDVFGRRFQYAHQYPISTLRDLIGDNASAPSDNELARLTRERQRPPIWGRQVLGELCSGDVHFIIELVGKMVEQAGGASTLTQKVDSPRVTASEQNEVIRKEAGSFLRNLRALPDGDRLVEVVDAFGAVAHSYLMYQDSKNENASPPHQASRIEPLENPKLDPEAQTVYDNLLRYSVFIEDVRGKSRRGNAVPRLYLRRFLIPHYNLTFSKRDSLEISVDDFRELLLAPGKFKERKRKRSKKPDGLEGMPLFEPRAPEKGGK